MILLLALLFIPSAQADTILGSFAYESTPDREICFNATSSHVPAGIKEITWDFGDGHMSNEENPCHVFSFLEPQRDYIVILTIQDMNHEENTAYQRVTVSNLNMYIGIMIILVCALLIYLADWREVKRRFRA